MARNQKKKKKFIKFGPVLFVLWQRLFWLPGVLFRPLRPPIVSKVTLNAILGIINESGVLRNQNKKKKDHQNRSSTFRAMAKAILAPRGAFFDP